MSDEKEKLKEQLHRKSLPEIDRMILEQKQKIKAEKSLTILGRLNSELSIMQEISNQKQRESDRIVRKVDKQPAKPELKSYDDYIKSKK